MKNFERKTGKYSLRYPKDLLFWILFCVYLVFTLFLFHRQTVSYNGRYSSDMLPYVSEIQGIDSGYDYPYPVMFWAAEILMLFTTPVHAMALAVGGFNALTAIALKYYFDRELFSASRKGSGQLSTLLVFGTLMVSMLFPFRYLGHYVDISEGTESFLYRYLGVFSPNPFHNATYLAARPFTVVIFFLIVDILREYEENTKWFRWDYAFLGLVLLAATMTKPSFTIVFLSCVGLILLFRLLKSRGKNFGAAFRLGIYFIPTLLDLLYQYRDVFTSKTADVEKGIGIGFLTAWGSVTDNVWVSVLLAIAFPISVLFFQGCRFLKRKPSSVERNTADQEHPSRIGYLLQFAWLLYLVSFFMLVFLYEKGYRLKHLNFSWGYMYGIFFLFAASVLTLARETRSRTQPVWQLLVQWIFFFLHLICGLDYFRVLLSGGLFH